MTRWRTEDLPLSVWGLDINWRNNAFGGNRCTKALPGQTCEYVCLAPYFVTESLGGTPGVPLTFGPKKCN